MAAAAAFLERAAALTLEPSRRAQRALAAARANYQAGALEAALALLATAKSGPLGELSRAQIDLLRGQISFASSRGADAAWLLLEAAKRLEPLDASLAGETYGEALAAATYAGRLAKGDGVLGVAVAALAAKPAGAPSGPPRAADLLIDGQALQITRPSNSDADVGARAQRLP